MTTLRRILAGVAFAALAAGPACADMMESFSTTFPLTPTDFGYTLTLPDFNIAGATLTGVEIIFYAAETSEVNILNLGENAQNNFDVLATSEIANNTDTPLIDSATGEDIFNGTTLNIFSMNGISLGSSSNPPCTAGTMPSVNCSSVSYGPLQDSVLLDDPAGYPIIQGAVVDGLGLNDTANLDDYIGSGSFTLSGGTYGNTAIHGAGSIAAVVFATGTVGVEVDYTYTSPNTAPEPTTMVLMGGAFLGLGLLGKRLKKN
jgi:hypothetical protein